MTSGRSTNGQFIRVLAFPLALLVVAIAAFFAVHDVSYFLPYRHQTDRVSTAIAIAIGTLLTQRIVDTLLARASRGVPRPPQGRGGQVLPLARRGVSIAILLMGSLAVLDQLGVSISPLLAGLGISGIAVALALQPLLTNIFAASYMLSDASISVGDYIVLQTGPSGRVEGIGWRATRLRDTEGSLVIVPNATLAGTTVTNYGIGGATLASIIITLPATTDLTKTEQTAEDALRALIATDPHALPHSEPVVRFQGIIDDRVQCLLSVQARTQSDVPALTHAIVHCIASQIGPGPEAAAPISKASVAQRTETNSPAGA